MLPPILEELGILSLHAGFSGNFERFFYES